jgi:hypothetical protein
MVHATSLGVEARKIEAEMDFSFPDRYNQLPRQGNKEDARPAFFGRFSYGRLSGIGSVR